MASSIGLQILRSKGGNAADAAIAVAAALAVLEPCSTGLGGDMFALFYSAKDKMVHAINGSGRAPAGTSIEKISQSLADSDGKDLHDFKSIHEKMRFHAHAVTVPGAARYV